jgi:hypothetical protein
MMKLSFVLASFVVSVAGVAHAQPATQDLYHDLIGKSYLAAKRELLLRGAVPIDDKKIQQQQGVDDCLMDSDICSLLEVSACAADRPLCTMEWRDKHGKRFTVQTSYSVSANVKGLTVDVIFRPDDPLVPPLVEP